MHIEEKGQLFMKKYKGIYGFFMHIIYKIFLVHVSLFLSTKDRNVKNDQLTGSVPVPTLCAVNFTSAHGTCTVQKETSKHPKALTQMQKVLFTPSPILHYFKKPDPDPHQILKPGRLKIEPWRVVDAHNGAVEGLYDSCRRFASLLSEGSGSAGQNERPDPDPHQS
jgi:hypothetical protein